MPTWSTEEALGGKEPGEPMLSIPADDARAVAIVTAIRTGDVEALQRHLRDSPDLAVARIVDDRRVARTLLHVLADLPGHFPNGPSTVLTLAAAGTAADARRIHSDAVSCPHAVTVFVGPPSIFLSLDLN